MAAVRVCFVCLGNICRSPIAENVMRKLVAEAGLAEQISIDSAGTSGYHAGDAPDPRACAAAKRRGVEMTGRARQFRPKDFQDFDYVVVMERANWDALAAIAPLPGALTKVALLRSFDPQAPAGAAVPDPYFGDDTGFDEVVALCEPACHGLLAAIRRERGL